jgi:hypothetical protein
VIDGDYQMGQVLAHIEESDGRYIGGVKWTSLDRKILTLLIGQIK